MASKPSIPKELEIFTYRVAKRHYTNHLVLRNLFSTHRKRLHLKPETLMWGKYGEEGDRLIFKILNSDYLAKANATI
jgi:hypothetical protein